MKEKTGFPPTFSAVMFQSSTDLIAAEGDGERQLLVTGVLCSEKESTFNECSSKYAKGIFQGIDGLEVETSLKVKVNGQK